MMEKIVECIPNFSEGRDAEKIELIISAITSVPGVVVLDAEMDADHHRSVITLAGEPAGVVEAAVRAAATAIELIDLNHHRGEHPRLGALDVLPFVPLKGMTMAECVELARLAGRRIAHELEIPVYFYEQAAQRPERVDLANVRRGEFEQLREEIGREAARMPDAGLPRLHPTAGAMAVGARLPLIAYNINLATEDLAIAKSIAKAVRGRDGGLRYLKALGIDLRNRRQVQVSMNLVNHEATPLHRVFEMVRREAARFGVAISGSEIIGLVPQAALDAAAEYYLQLDNFSPELILENRLAAELARLETTRPGSVASFPPPRAISAVTPPPEPEELPAYDDEEAEADELGPTLDSFIADVASEATTLAGGSVAAYAGALGAALGVLVCRVTAAQTPRLERDLGDITEQLQHLSLGLRLAVSEEAEGRISVLDAMALPAESEAERLARGTAIEEATRNGIAVPLRVVEQARQTLELLLELIEVDPTRALTDLTVAAQLALAALRAAACTVLSQLMMSSDEDFNRARRIEMMNAMGRGQEILHRIEKLFFGTYPI